MNSTIKICVVLSIMFVISCSNINSISDEVRLNDYVDIVNPMIGTDWHGHTFPGSVLPHGMIQLSPDTGSDNWDHCSGYHYAKKSILGFSHTHLSGPGAGGGLDILFMPTIGNIKLNPGDTARTEIGYRSNSKKGHYRNHKY